MRADLRFVFDTNVLISAALSLESTPGNAVDLAVANLAFSRETWQELVLTILRPKFACYFQPGGVDSFLATIHPEKFVHVTTPVHVCRDPQDDKFLALAQTCRATAIVTGDLDLLSMKEWGSLPILSPADFLAQFEPR